MRTSTISPVRSPFYVRPSSSAVASYSSHSPHSPFTSPHSPFTSPHSHAAIFRLHSAHLPVSIPNLTHLTRRSYVTARPPDSNPYLSSTLKSLEGTEREYISLQALDDDRVNSLPLSIRVLLESAVRNCDGKSGDQAAVENLLDWPSASVGEKEIPFNPARVLLQDLTGVPVMCDLAALRDALGRNGCPARRVNPAIPVELVVDHSIDTDFAMSESAAKSNEQAELERNRERFMFLKWGASVFSNVAVLPPGTGILHQVNIEYLARVVMHTKTPLQKRTQPPPLLYPDSVIGTDSHTTMVNGLGVVGWGVGGIEAEAVMLGQPMSMVVPAVVAVHLTGSLAPTVTATDLVLHTTHMLREFGVSGAFVEFYGPGLSNLPVADRVTMASMAPDYGAKMGFFAVDDQTLEYLLTTGRSKEKVDLIRKYLIEQQLFVDHGDIESLEMRGIEWSDVIELDLNKVERCIAGPKRPQDTIRLTDASNDFKDCLTAPPGHKGYGVNEVDKECKVTTKDGQDTTMRHGSVVIAAITSCTNTSNPALMFAAALLARNAQQHGLRASPHVKCSLSPGSKTVIGYLTEAGLMKDLEALGFHHTGFGCMTSVGNSGDLDPSVSSAITTEGLVAVAVLSGNRNFEGRIHSLARAAYLASPPLVVAYAIAGRMDIDFEKEAIGVSKDGVQIYLRDLWPSKKNISDLEAHYITPSTFSSVYNPSIFQGTEGWNELSPKIRETYEWDEKSTYIRRPPFFDNLEIDCDPIPDMENAHCLLSLGDSVTTDHISPAGVIARDSPAARYLLERGVSQKEFNSYGGRRGNDEVMVRGMFANIRTVNKMCPSAGAKAVHVPSGDILPVFEAAQRYWEQNIDLIIIAGSDYGCGSSRDWAAKGTKLLGVRVVIAESFEPTHRSNLVGMGVLPVQFKSGQSANSLGLTGTERFSMKLKGGELLPRQRVTIETDDGKKFDTISRIDTEVETEQFMNGGVLPLVWRKIYRQERGKE
eukprot:GHVN01005811.1.p1 GENE.GHVN01005811.1~~GHVN01005811.1.p1  ORF type:complete len:989 (-),score=211.14 GHVN01005811.1:86-3052(-)